jgi:ABC-type Mn2+/Zn2+ transport system ATPase subunit
MSIAIALRGVSFGYAQAQPVLTDVDLEIAPGELVAIAGPNGGGAAFLLTSGMQAVRVR